MTEPDVAPELEPRFLVTVTLDGDDDPQKQTENALFSLDTHLSYMQQLRLIRAYTIERAP